MKRGESVRPELRTGMPAKYQGLLAAVGFVAVMVLSLAGQVWLGPVMALVFVSALRMSARIRFEDAGLSVRVAGLFSTTIAYREITTVATGPSTGLREGMGLRILPGGGTGYLVGGPTIRIQTAGAWLLVSCADPAGAVAYIRTKLPEPT
ncbi:hypothetical protein [Pseudarthrobacter sp. 1C304]|uniref:hypothetical protein n=1 Tax=Pseudarthrobacter sp. 1C304 TaxID=3457438 RepID=UPI003FD0A611